MHKKLNIWLGLYLLVQTVLTTANADPAVEVLKQDFEFPNKIVGFPAKLSDIKGLEINYFTTNDGVKLAYWQAGKGKPVIFVPGWSANGADFIDVIYLLSSGYKVIVLDPRNQGLSEQVRQGQRISRYSMDLKQLTEHLAIKKADFVGWSMGAAVLWGYIDLFGTDSINKLVWIDEPISIYTREDWSEQERRNAGGMTTSAERMIAAFAGAPTNNQVVDMKVMERFMAQDSLHFQNSQAFARAVIKNNPEYMAQVLFDHITNDWRDVVQYKLDMPVAIFSGELSHNLPSQQWAQSVIPGSKLYVYTAAEQGDHFLAAKNPVKFVADLKSFLQ
ncbi:MhpC protein [Rheinheimera sp. KL1]|uniref:alpha/beta fold hydrolase n=1 Tax=Rheinheimera sp. KL1 TaxID=1635005 RepID=UPI0006A94759|nr:alpha/beta hydrolase [Rheinheimera sp. KL1]KOO57368.1 MhpC protein [Rheinheimera sp. KL1]